MNKPKENFTLIETIPGSEDWLGKRKGEVGLAIGSSIMGAAAGISQYKSRNQVVRELMYGSDFRGNAATEHGQRFEGLCASRWAELNQTPTFEVGICRPTPNNTLFNQFGKVGYPYFGVSVDRWACKSCEIFSSNENIREHVQCHGFRVIECKCPYSMNSFRSSYDRKIKDEHLAQLHLQMAVLGIREIEYMVLQVSKDEKIREERSATVHFSDEFWNWIYPKALEVILVAIDALWSEEEPEELEDVEEMPPRVSVVWNK